VGQFEPTTMEKIEALNAFKVYSFILPLKSNFEQVP
jgi:hypothetical protein